MADTPKIVDLSHPIYERDGKKYRVFDTAAGEHEFEVNDAGEPLQAKISIPSKDGGKPRQVRPRLGHKSESKVAQRLRDRSALDRLREDHPEEYEKVEGLISRGVSSYQIAQDVHEWGLLKDIKWETIKHGLQRHRRRELKARIEKALTSKDGDPEKILQRISVINTMEKVVATQIERFDKVVKLEADKPLMMDLVGKESDRLMDYLGRIANMYFETGLMARAPKVMKGVVASGTDAITGARVVSFELREDELPLIEGIRDELGQYRVPAPQ